MSRRRCLAALAALPLLALGSPGAAIASGRKRLAFLSGSTREEFLEEATDIGKALSESGWREGSNLEILMRFAEGDAARVPALVKEIVDAKPDAIWVAGNPRTRALQQATRTIPLFAILPDPVGDGFAQSLARPGGNVTGLSLGIPETLEKGFELLRLVLPRLRALALVVPAAMAAVPPRSGDRLTRLLRESGIEWKRHGVESIDELRAILRNLPKDGQGAAYLWPPRTLDPRAVAKAAIDTRVPTIADEAFLVEMGVLMSYQLYHDDRAKRTGAVLDKLLRGADPATIPFDLPTRSVFAFNRKTAAAIGVTFPADLVLRADKVFD
jgi:putative ABC transport system substrate-binding protein